jgi:hypothetical protein
MVCRCLIYQVTLVVPAHTGLPDQSGTYDTGTGVPDQSGTATRGTGLPDQSGTYHHVGF